MRFNPLTNRALTLLVYILVFGFLSLAVGFALGQYYNDQYLEQRRHHSDLTTQLASDQISAIKLGVCAVLLKVPQDPLVVTLEKQPFPVGFTSDGTMINQPLCSSNLIGGQP